MAKNKLSDLNNHLFEAMERLNDDEYMKENSETEIERSKSIVGIGKTIIDNGRLILDAQKHAEEYGVRTKVDLPDILKIGSNDE